MPSYRARRGMGALPEIVLNTAADPARISRLTVDADNAGASTVELQVHGDQIETDPAERMLDALADEVGQNVTAS